MPLAPLTTLRVGPVARRLITCTTTEQVVAALRGLRDEGVDPLVLAGGSNVVIADESGRADRGAAGECANHRRRQHDSCGSRCGVGRRGACRDRRPASAGWNACRAFRARSGPPRCRTSARTAPRWPTPSPGCGCSTVAPARCAGCPRRDLGFGYRTSVLKNPPPDAGADRGRGGVRPRRDGRQRAASVRRAGHGAGAPSRGARRPGAGARRRAGPAPAQGHGARRGRPRHLERRVVLHQPRGDPATVRASCGPRSTARCPTIPAAGRREAGGGRGWSSGPASARASPATGHRPGCPAKHALALTNRGTATSGDVIALARQVRDGVARRFRHPVGARTRAHRHCDLISRFSVLVAGPYPGST